MLTLDGVKPVRAIVTVRVSINNGATIFVKNAGIEPTSQGFLSPLRYPCNANSSLIPIFEKIYTHLIDIDD